MQAVHPQTTRASDEKTSDLDAPVGYQPHDGDVEGHKVGHLVTRDHINDGFDPAFLKKTMRRIDMRLVPILAALYAVSLIDRTNISLARAAGMGASLGLNRPGSQEYSYAVLAFFPTYIVFELPSNIGMRKFGAPVWLGGATVLWGIVMTMMGLSKTADHLIAMRAILGIFEAALFPGAVYLLSSWYLRHEVQKRVSIFYSFSVLASGLSAILAYGLAHIKMYPVDTRLIRTRGYLGEGWRSIFFLEGIATVLLGVAGYFLLVSFPEQAKFLTPEQKQMVTARIDMDRADATPDGLTLKKVGTYAIDLKLWTFAIQFFSATLGSYSLSYFLPQILAGMGFSGALSQILVAPPYVAALFIIIAAGVFSDRTRVRTPFIAGAFVLLIIGTCLYTYTRSVGARYFGVILAVSGCNTAVPLIAGYSQISIRKASKRAYTSALVVAAGGLGGIASGLAFTQKQSPHYNTGVRLTLAMSAISIVICLGQHLFFRMQNAKADRGETVLEDHEDYRYQL